MEITQEIPATLEAALHQALRHDGSASHLVNLKVEFGEAGASALHMRVLADFAGAAAPRYNVLRRAIQRQCVEICNAHGWVIPFAQLTLHMAPTSGNSTAPAFDSAMHQGEPGVRHREA